MLCLLFDKDQTICENRFGRSQGVNDTKDNEIVIWGSEAFVFKLHYECKTLLFICISNGKQLHTCTCSLYDFRDEFEFNSIGVMSEQA